MPEKLILRTSLSPGDIVVMTAAVRDLHRAWPGRFLTDVRTTAQALWEHNPHVTPLEDADANVRTLDLHYPLIQHSNRRPYHFLHGYAQDLAAKLGVEIPLTDFRGDIHLSAEERGWMNQVEETGHRGPYWILVAGGKYDFTAKWWDPTFYQQVVDHFRDRILFVRCGERHHFHPPLRGVLDFVGRTDVRQFVRLMYHTAGALCPVTFAMHLAAAVPTPPGRPPHRACVVLGGGREPAHWEAYPHHQFLSVNGALDCCDDGGCWKSRCQPVGDGDPKDRDLCVYPEPAAAGPGVPEGLQVPRCMRMLTPEDVIRRIEYYHEGGALQYLGSSDPTDGGVQVADEADTDESTEDLILDHVERPRRSGRAKGFTHFAARRNPLCGDEIELTARVRDGRLAEVRWEGRGCVLSRASASMFCEAAEGRTVEEVLAMSDEDALALLRTPLSPARRVCVALPLIAARAALGT